MRPPSDVVDTAIVRPNRSAGHLGVD
jgi:hypothetical protein